ncbi:MAG: hypothetical protein EOL88_12300 [Bacteroidia bacterium]|nr:hypothetical protein [Bacteroidia bacterium]
MDDIQRYLHPSTNSFLPFEMPVGTFHPAVQMMVFNRNGVLFQSFRLKQQKQSFDIRSLPAESYVFC